MKRNSLKKAAVAARTSSSSRKSGTTTAPRARNCPSNCPSSFVTRNSVNLDDWYGDAAPDAGNGEAVKLPSSGSSKSSSTSKVAATPTSADIGNAEAITGDACEPGATLGGPIDSGLDVRAGLIIGCGSGSDVATTACAITGVACTGTACTVTVIPGVSPRARSRLIASRFRLAASALYPGVPSPMSSSAQQRQPVPE